MNPTQIRPTAYSRDPVPLLFPRAHVHLLGICGTGMGSLAGMFHESGYRVTGSDANVYPPMSDFLRDLGIHVNEGYQRRAPDPRAGPGSGGKRHPQGKP